MSTDNFAPNAQTRLSSKTVGHIKRYALNGPTMGTRYSAIFYATDDLDIAELTTKMQTAVDTVDNQMSPWKPQSALVQFNQTPLGVAIQLPREFATVLARAQQISSASNGAFGIYVGKITNAWGFGPHNSEPDHEQIKAVADFDPSDIDAIQFDPVTGIACRRKDVQIDLCGIAKGYGVDLLGEALDHAGISNYLVSIDGEMKSSGEKPDGEAWVVGIEEPNPEMRQVARTLELNNLAVASSGNYRHQVVRGETIHSHTIDPKTNAPVSNNLAAVTVLADDCMSADAWATVLMVMGERAGPSFAEAHDLSALFFVQRGSGDPIIETGIFARS